MSKVQPQIEKTTSFEERVAQLTRHKSPAIDRIPAIPLYMDQVLSYLDTTLRPLEGNIKEPCFTKTMINNYVKSGVLKPPVKKKYDQYQLMTLTMLYRLKKGLPLKHIDIVLGHLQEAEIAKNYNSFLEVEEKVGQVLSNTMTHLPQMTDSEEDLSKLRDAIVSLAVEADAKVRLAEELVALYRRKLDEKP